MPAMIQSTVLGLAVSVAWVGPGFAQDALGM